MKLTITANFDLNALDKLIEQRVDTWLDTIKEKYRKAGRQFVERARSRTKEAHGSFGNITWNLRSSIGYLLLYNGVVEESYFPTLQGAPEGSTTGDAYARELATDSRFDSGISLICVAGMEYAFFVQQKGYDVIKGSSVYFESELKGMLGV